MDAESNNFNYYIPVVVKFNLINMQQYFTTVEYKKERDNMSHIINLVT